MRLTFLLLVGVIIAACTNKQTVSYDSVDQRVDSLMSLMTLEEKAGQLNLYNGSWDFTGPVPKDNNNQQKAEFIKNGKVGAMLNVTTAKAAREAQKLAVENSRLGIPMLFGYDVIHGYQTMFPIPLGQAASWDPEVARIGAEVAAREAAVSGINWTFAPMVDIVRDARWGRMMESPGEDPFLASVMSKAWVNGFQGGDLSNPKTIAACAKHFAAYGFAEAGRDYNTVDISKQTLYNVALPPFQAAVEANVATFMNAFNEIAGVPATGSKFLQRDVLKGDWKYDGFVVSDWGSIGEMITHGFAKDTLEAGLKALVAGSDMDMEARVYENSIEELINTGKVDIKLLDDAVRRILKIKFGLGLFEDPYRYCDEEGEKSELMSQTNLDAARDAARKSIVLLKNDDDILPLPKSGKRIAVIGSLAESKDVPLGSWRAQAVTNSAISLLEGIQNANTDNTIQFEQGYNLTTGDRQFVYELNIVNGDRSGFSKAVDLSKKSDVVILALGEDCFQSGEGRSQTEVGLKGDQLELFNQIISVNQNVVVTLMNGRSLAIPELEQKAKAILEVWHLGSMAGDAIADVVFGDYNPSGKLPVCFPRSVGQVPIYYNHKNTGRPRTNDHDAGMVFWSHYTDEKNSSLFPFGHGLSYTKFEISAPTLSADNMRVDGTIDVKVSVKNVGPRPGKETVQFYIRDYVGSVTRPVKELKDYRQLELAVGEEKVVTFTIDNEMLSYFRSDLTFGSEPGDFAAMVGSSSADVKSVDFTLN